MTDIYKAMVKMDMTPEILAIRFERDQTLIDEWLAGTKQPPPYWLYAMKAVRNNLKPADNVTMHKPYDLAAYIGAPRDTVPYWLRTGQFPIMARYAVAWVNKSVSPALTSGDVRIMRMLHTGYYFRIGHWYTSRPILGKPLSRIRPPIVEKLLARGYANQSPSGHIKLSSKGRKYLEDSHK